MKKFILLLILFKISSICVASSIDSTIFYPVVVKFQSVCCGVPSDAPLKVAIQKFKKKNHLKSITAYHIGPLGREGEYIIGFTLAGFKKKQKAVFINKIKQTTAIMKDRGNAEVEINYTNSVSKLPTRASIEKIDF